MPPDCSICINTIKLDKYDKNIVILNCGHVYHKKCLNKWVKKQIQSINKPNCPMCRADICDIQESKLYVGNTNYDSDSD